MSHWIFYSVTAKREKCSLVTLNSKLNKAVEKVTYHFACRIAARCSKHLALFNDPSLTTLAPATSSPEAPRTAGEVNPTWTQIVDPLTSSLEALGTEVTVKFSDSVLLAKWAWSLRPMHCWSEAVGTSEAKRTSWTVRSLRSNRPLARGPTRITPFNFNSPSRLSLTALRLRSTNETCRNKEKSLEFTVKIKRYCIIFKRLFFEALLRCLEYF